MIRAEIYKLRTHRTPWVCAAALLVGVVSPSIVLIWYTPNDPSAYTTNLTEAYDVLGVLLGIVFGGWLLGTEYRQHTIKRFLTSETRRLRAFTTKGLVGAGAMSVVLGAVGTIGWAAARIVGSMHDVTVTWQGRTMLAAALTGLVAAAVAYSLSAITRSDSFAMVGTVALVLILDPFLGLIPRFGKYTLGSALNHMYHSVSGTQYLEVVELSTSTATFLLIAWIAALLSIAGALFTRRDVS